MAGLVGGAHEYKLPCSEHCALKCLRGLSSFLAGCQAELWGEDLEETGILLSGRQRAVPVLQGVLFQTLLSTRCAYAPQKPAVLSGSSIRDNVVFGSTWDAHRPRFWALELRVSLHFAPPGQV